MKLAPWVSPGRVLRDLPTLPGEKGPQKPFFSDILSRDFTPGTSPPCSSKFSLLFSFGEKVWKQYRRSVEGSVEKRRNRKGNCSAPLGRVLHQRGLVVKNSRKGVETKPRLWVPQKEFEQGPLCLF